MIQSMTGYGKSTLEIAGKTFTVEIKSLNSKNLDANVRMPSEFRELELPLRNKLSQSLSREKSIFRLRLKSMKKKTLPKST